MAYGERGSVGFATPAEKIFEVGFADEWSVEPLEVS